MDNTTYNIQKQAHKDEQQATRWLKDNGLNVKYFADLNLHLIEAQRIAANILKHNKDLLANNEAHSLRNFLQAMKDKNKRAKLTSARAYKIMNLGHTVNRRMFKALKTR